jgi:FixJ family two-component response regulator
VSYVLVVDDEPAIRKTVARILARHVEVRAAHDTETALVMIRDAEPSVLICDVHMPGASGLSLAERVREIAPVTAIVFLTGDSELPPSATFARGVVAYILKPFHANDLLDAVCAGERWSESHQKHANAIARPSTDRNSPG